MKLGKFTLISLSDGTFWLDGGAMFGVVPKVIWEKLNPADELNRIELGLNPLLIQTGEKNILIDTGIGDKFDEKFKKIFRVDKSQHLLNSLGNIGLKPEDIDIVINTHLHFDHCGGNTCVKEGKIVPTFPNAKYVIQKGEWENAINPNERTRASYLKENFVPIEEAGQLELIEGDVEILPGIRVYVTGGHTKSHQVVFIEAGDKKAVYLGDLIPTASHIKLPYIMGYDLYPIETLEKKRELLPKAISENWLLVFEHDPKITMGYLEEKEGKFLVKPIQE